MAVMLPLLLVTAASAALARETITPVESVLNLLGRLKTQIVDEGRREATSYDKFACFCKEQASDKLYSTTKGNEKIELLSAEIKELAGAITQLNQEIMELNIEVGGLEKKCAEAQRDRDEAHNSYIILKTDLSDAIAGASEAIELLGSKKMEGGAALVQEKIGSFMERAMAVQDEFKPKQDQVMAITSLLDEDPASSEFHSDKVLEQMVAMKKKFKTHLNDLDAEEANRKHEFDMSQGARKNQLRALGETVEEAEAEVAAKENQKNMDAEDKSKTEQDVTADTAFLDDLTTQCEEKATAWDTRSKTRASEISAITEALATLKGQVSGNYEKNKKVAGLVSSGAKLSKGRHGHGHWVWINDKKASANSSKASFATEVSVEAQEGIAKEAAKAEEADTDASDSAADATDADTTDSEANIPVPDDVGNSGYADGDSEDESYDGYGDVEDNQYDGAEYGDDAVDDGSDASDEEGYSFLQKRRIQKDNKRKHSAKELALAKKMLSYLNTQAKDLKSDVLAALVLKMKEDHFVRVRGMIKDMIAKLTADADGEADQKGWCDGEVDKATAARDENSALIEGDTAELTSAEAKIERIAEEITLLNEQLGELKKGVSEAAQLRAGERVDNQASVTAATEGLAGVTQAMKILRDFYDNAFLQTSAAPAEGADSEGNTVDDVAPETFSRDYAGNQDAASGILGQLDVIKSDFEATIEKTNTGESDAEEMFNNYKSDTEEAITEKENLVKTKTGEQKETKGALMDAKDKYKEHNRLKGEALDELSKLKASCTETGSEFADKVARREQEIASLKNAYVILDEMR